MREKVEAWEAPEAFQGLKKFMLEQIETSTQFMGPATEPTRQNPGDWYEQQLKWVRQDILRAEERLIDRWGGSPRNAHVAIMLEKNGKGSAVAWLESTVWVNSDFHDGDTGSGLHKARFTPGDVRLLIETALDTGWDPEIRGRWEFPAGLKLTDFQTCGR